MRAPRPDTLLLVFGLVMGTAALTGFRPNGGFDELRHLFRAHQIATGTMIPLRDHDMVGGWMPGRLHASWMKAVRPPAADGTFFADFRNLAMYTPVPYAPHAIAFAVAEPFAPSLQTLGYIGRAAGLVTGLVLAWLAIRTTPVLPWAFLVLALSPMAVRQMTTITADTVTNGAVALLLAMVLRLVVDRNPPTNARLAALGITAVTVALAKQAYVPVLGLLGLVVLRRGRDTWRLTCAIAAIVVASLAATVGWSVAVRDLYLPQYFVPTADPGAQIAYLCDHPAAYLGLILNEVLARGGERLVGSLGYTAPVPRALAWLHAGLLLAAIARERHRIDLVVRLTALTVSIASLLAVVTAAYLGWHAIGATALRFNPRYILPLLPLVVVALAPALPRRFYGPWLDAVLAAGVVVYALATAVVLARTW